MKDSERLAVLKSVQRVREGVDSHRHAPFARHALRIPERDYHALCKLNPDLQSTDPDVRQAAWDWFEQSPFSDAYRVGKIVRGVIKNGIIQK